MKIGTGDPLEGAGSQVALLHRISGIVSSGMALPKMLDELVGLVAGVTSCDACLVYLVEPARGEIVLCASQLPHAAEIGNIRMKIGEGVTGWVAERRSVVALSSRASSDPRFKSFTALPEDTYEALLSVPLISGGDVAGVINVHHKKPRKHAPEEVALLSYVAEQMGGAIAKARLSERSEAAAKKVEMLAAVGHTITTEGYLDRILQVISEMVAETFDSPVCSIMIVDEYKQELSIKAARCSSPEFMQKLPIKIVDSLIGRVVRERQYVAVLDVAAEKSYRYPELARKTGLASLLSVPLLAGQKVIGTLNIYTGEQRSFTEEEIIFSKAVAGQAALAFENARLMSETLEMKQLLEARKVIERAKGILQHRHGITEEQAYLDLRGESRRLRRPMRDLAEAIILAEELHRKGEQKDV
ncbi:MAG: GAF and ANTAR domain-containing protein [Acidobacteria bacterium]|nr:GAF and ANTAR domain-containing protein [Acidobacteriota bacterium]